MKLTAAEGQFMATTAARAAERQVSRALSVGSNLCTRQRALTQWHGCLETSKAPVTYLF